MRHILYFMLITAFNVGIIVTENIKYNRVDHNEKTQANIPTTAQSRLIPQSKKGFSLNENLCYVGYSMCFCYHRDKLKMEVCAHHTIFKLVDFDNLCEVHLQNCLYKAEKEAKKHNVPDLFYYNQQGKKCQYYLDKGKTFEEAVRLYHLEGGKKKIPNTQ